MFKTVFAAVCFVLLSLAATVSAADYYVSVAGNDANAGTSSAAAWRSLGRASAATLNPGDRILLRGGDTLAGSLSLDASDRGTPTAPITVTSYGIGRATINSATAGGIFVYNTAGVVISNVNLVGAGGAASGISFYNDLPGDVRLPYIRIDGVDVSGFGRDGIEIGAWNNASGFRDVRVTNSAVHGNGRTGLLTYAQLPNVHQQVFATRVLAYDNPGITGASGNTGSGIVFGSVDGGTIERSVAHGNGRLSTTSGGPVGIWTYDSNAIVIQHNESYANRTAGPADGGGFDLDQNVSNSIVQFNYSHDNDGAGYLLAQSLANDGHRGNVVRYNISQNDGRKNSYGGIEIWGRVRDAEIHNNTVSMTAPAAGAPRPVRIWNAGVTTLYPSRVHLRNNVFLTGGGLALVDVTAGVLAGAVDLRFEGNDYFASGAPLQLRWGGTTYSGLPAWRVTGQEVVAGLPTGLAVDPALTGAGTGPALGDADQLETLAAYRLQSTSALVDKGIDLELQFGVSAGPADFYGGNARFGGAPDVGAHELAASGGTPSGRNEILILASQATTLGGAWRRVADTTAAGGARVSHPNAGAAKLASPLAAPVHYFEVTFEADAGTPYRLWMRGRAEGNAWSNDSVFVQISDAVDGSGAPVFRPGTTSATTVNLEEDNNAGVSGWGWQDNGWGTGVFGPVLRFATSGVHTMRIQTREDGFSIDQIVLSARAYLSSSPGSLKNDTTIVGSAPPPPPVEPAAPAEVVIYASDIAAGNLHGNWQLTGDATAAAGVSLSNPDRGVAKITTPAASPGSYVDVPFTAQAGVSYHVWLRMRATGNSYGNDSVFIQLSGAIDSAGLAVSRIGTSQANTISLQDDNGALISGWGWNDTGWATLGAPFVFAQTGAQTLRIQQREDGILIDQIVISPSRYLSTPPGALNNDTTIVVR